MKLEKAIELIEHCAHTHARYDRVEIKAALRLGIEGLKRIQELNPYPHGYIGGPLPGETEE